MAAATETAPKLGDVGTVAGIRSKLVGFRTNVRGPILEEPARYVVFVEQEGAYRMGTAVRSAWRAES